MRSNSTVKLLIIACLYVSYSGAATTRKGSLFPLDIIHYNDFHVRFEETSVLFTLCTTNDTNCIGGFPRLYQEVKTLLKEKPDALVLNAGDAFQGTYWFTLLKWNVTQHFINMLPNDAHTLGNHEFDNGVEDLVSYLAALRAPVVVANMNTTQEPALSGLYKPRIVIERRGRKIGIIGVITADTWTSSKSGKVIFTDPIKAVKEQAQILTNNGVDIIIVLSHCGIVVDRKIAKEAGENVDIIVGGHTHTLLWNHKPAPSEEQVYDIYPVIEESEVKSGHRVLVVTASAFTKYLGNITTYFDDNGEMVSFSGDPVFLNRSIPEDQEIKALLQPYTEYLHKVVSRVVARTEKSILRNDCGAIECDIGNLAADSMLYAAKKYAPTNLTAVAFLNTNMIRGSLSRGDITVGDMVNLFPFGNKLISYTIKGRYLLQALSLGLTKAWKWKLFSGPWVPQVAGMKLTVNTTSLHVISVLVKHGEVFEPLEMDQDYQLTTPDFLVTVGNSHPMLKHHNRDSKIVGVDYEIFEDYISKISPLTNYLDGRFVTVT